MGDFNLYSLTTGLMVAVTGGNYNYARQILHLADLQRYGRTTYAVWGPRFVHM